MRATIVTRYIYTHLTYPYQTYAHSLTRCVDMQLSYNWVELSKRAHENAVNVYHRLQCVPFNPQAFIICISHGIVFISEV